MIQKSKAKAFNTEYQESKILLSIKNAFIFNLKFKSE